MVPEQGDVQTFDAPSDFSYWFYTNGFSTASNEHLGKDNLTTEIWSNTFGTDLLAHDWFYTSGSTRSTRLTNNMSDPMAAESVYTDGVAKSVRGWILSDLGQSISSNLFASPHKTVNFINASVQSCHDKPPARPEDSEMCYSLLERDPTAHTAKEWLLHPTSTDPTAFYEWQDTGIPDVQPAYISTQYLCNVPKMKSTASLIFSVVIADLVFLQALWTLLNWAVTTHLQRVNPEAMYCRGCAKTVGNTTPVPATKEGYTLVAVQGTDSPQTADPQRPEGQNNDSRNFPFQS
jgi:hypothetical protein